MSCTRWNALADGGHAFGYPDELGAGAGGSVGWGFEPVAEWSPAGTHAKHTGTTCGRPSLLVVARWPTRPVARRSMALMRGLVEAPGHAISETLGVPNVTLIPIDGLPEIKPGDDLVGMLLAALKASGEGPQTGDGRAPGPEEVRQARGGSGEARARPAVPGTDPAGGVDAHHVSAHVGEHHPGERAGSDPGEPMHTHAG